MTKDKMGKWNKNNSGNNMNENRTRPGEVATIRKRLFRKVHSKMSEWMYTSEQKQSKGASLKWREEALENFINMMLVVSLTINISFSFNLSIK